MADERANRKALGTRLRDARNYCGFSQEDVARYLSVPRSAVSLIESGSRSVTVLELGRLAELYQRSIESLAGQSEGEPEPESVSLLARATADLSEQDRQEVLRFAQFLQQRGKSG